MTADAGLVRDILDRIENGLAARGGDGVAEVRERLAAQDFSDAAFRMPAPAAKPVVRVLDETLKALKAMDTGMADALSATAPALHWAQSASYSDDILGEGFSQNYAWAQLVGGDGFFAGDDFQLGLLLLGPDRHYLDHYHPAPELYWPLTPGSLWRKGGSDFVERQQGEVIWHPSMVTHATITRKQPLLAVYVWTRQTETSARLCALDETAKG